VSEKKFPDAMPFRTSLAQLRECEAHLTHCLDVTDLLLCSWEGHPLASHLVGTLKCVRIIHDSLRHSVRALYEAMSGELN